MAWIIVGLGNPGEEYARTRHNTGRLALERFAHTYDVADWKEDPAGKRASSGAGKKNLARVATGIIGKQAVVLVAPDTFMNKSGNAVAKYVKSVKAAGQMIVVYDDLDLPLGAMKLSFDRGSGGHKGLESVIRAVKTKKFARVRIGVSPSTASGALKKPSGEKEVLAFILQKFPAHEMEELERVFKRTTQALETIVRSGVPVAMNRFN